MPSPNQSSLPSLASPDGVGWRLRPRGAEYRLGDRDPRGQEPVRGATPENISAPSPLNHRHQYAELHCHTCYSFREGASTPRELVVQAAMLDYRALAITDRDGLYGAMEFARAAHAAGVRPIMGADVTLQGGYQLVLLAETREGYANLCTLLSRARGVGPGAASPPARPAEAPEPRIRFSDLAKYARGLIALSGDEHGEVPSLVAAGQRERARAAARRYAKWFGRENFFLELQQTLTYGDTERNRRLQELAAELELGVVATNDVWYHIRERHRLHDVLTAIRHRTTLDGSHRLRHANSERFLKSATVMVELFTSSPSPLPLEGRGSDKNIGGTPPMPPARGGFPSGLPDEVPEAIRNTLRIAERCQFDLVHDLGYQFPSYPVPQGETPQSHLALICWQALERKYPDPQETPLLPQRERLGEGNPSGGVPRTLDPSRLRPEAEKRLEEELALVEKHGLAGFFLAYYDLLQLAGEVAGELRGRDPRLPPDERPVGRGRGSSVSSITCYLIGLSHVDPVANELFLGRFLNDELPSVPDIDLDFPRDIREQLLKRVWTKFEGGRAALVGAFATYRTRGAIRDVGKALGLPALELDHLAKLSDAWPAGQAANPDAAFASSQGLGPESEGWLADQMASLPQYRARLKAPLWRDLADLTQQLMGFPRHVTQHVGGVVLSAQPMQELVPLEPTRMDGRVMCQWDKDSVDDARMVKIDFLALGMLSLVDECLNTIEHRHGERPDLGRIPHDDPEVYDQICAGDTIGTFQIESRAQITTLAHTQPRNLDDLAVQVAIVRPGPIVGGAFKPYMEYRRRLREAGPAARGEAGALASPPDVGPEDRQAGPAAKGEAGASESPQGPGPEDRQAGPAAKGEAGALESPQDPGPEGPIEIKYVHPFLEPVLKDTLGVVLYQEQVVQVAMAIAGYTAGEADLLRRNLNRRRGAELASQDWPKFLQCALDRGVPESAARAAFQSILGFAAYGFPKSHAVAFGLLAYESTWLRHYYPAEFYAALFNNQPMGFYSTEVIAGDARRHGIEILRPDVNLSELDCGVVGGPALGRIRLGLGQVKGVSTAHAAVLVAERKAHGPLESLFDCVRRMGLPPEALENLILAGAFDDLGEDRRGLLWELGLIRTRYADAGAALARPGRAQQSASTELLRLPVEQDMVRLAPMTEWEEVVAEYETLGFAPRQHALAYLRPALEQRDVTARRNGQPPLPEGEGDAATAGSSPLPLLTSAEIQAVPDGSQVRVAGLVTCRQRPSTAKGVVFVSLEDEFGLANVVVYPKLFERQRILLVTQPFLIVEGRVQRQQTVVHIIAHHFERPELQTDRLISVSHDFR
ncbi:MAG: PHP domain-containing protein [Chloroflexi bacterium]|nr:PHP domain-containing protein [Chloroflexota bacterium]